MLKQNTRSLATFLLSPIKYFLLAIFCLTLTACTDTSPPSDDQIIVWPEVNDCDLHTQACQARQGEQLVQLKISPHPIPIAIPLGIEVILHNIQAKKVELDIAGANMYMGYNRVTLIPDSHPERYIGTTMLAFCTVEKMQWKITLIIHQTNGTHIQVPYLLETQMHEMY